MKRPLRVGLVVAITLLAASVRSASGAAPTYVVTDLGNLGGTDNAAYAISSNGLVAGTAQLADSTYHAFFWSKTGGMVDLGTLGGTSSGATAVNALGQVAGSSTTAGGATHAFFWSKATGMRDLGTLPGDTSSAAAGISATGQVVGGSSDPSGVPHAFSWTRGGGMQSLAARIGGADSAATAISADGDIAGWYLPGASGVQHPFLLPRGGKVIDLGLDHAYATAISPNGDVVVGSYSISLAPIPFRASMKYVTEGFVWTRAGGLASFAGIRYAQVTHVTGVNDAEEVVGQVEEGVGFYWTPANGGSALWQGQPGGPAVQPAAINNAGQIAATDWQHRALLLTPAVAPPHATVAPAFSGLLQVGGTLTASRGTWVGTRITTFRYRWLLSHDGGATWTAAATGTRFRLPASSLGALVKVTISAVSRAGTATSDSDPSDPIGPAVVNAAPPTLTGTARVGHALTASRGSWSGVSLAYAYRWYASRDGGASWSLLARAGSRYVLPAKALGAIVRVDVTATNAWGTLTVSSPPTGVVTR